jgi:hypothetical protein
MLRGELRTKWRLKTRMAETAVTFAVATRPSNLVFVTWHQFLSQADRMSSLIRPRSCGPESYFWPVVFRSNFVLCEPPRPRNSSVCPPVMYASPEATAAMSSVRRSGVNTLKS